MISKTCAPKHLAFQIAACALQSVSPNAKPGLVACRFLAHHQGKRATDALVHHGEAIVVNA